MSLMINLVFFLFVYIAFAYMIDKGLQKNDLYISNSFWAMLVRYIINILWLALCLLAFMSTAF
jgi:hypothetical protein